VVLPRRILYILQPGGGGAATSLYDLIAGLDQQRYRPYVLFFEPDYYCDKFRELGVKVFVLNQRYPLLKRILFYIETDHVRKRYGKFVWKLYWLAHVGYLLTRVIALLKWHRITIVHNNDTILKDRFTILAAKLAGVKQVCHIRSCSDLASPFRKKMALSVDAFIYVSKMVEAYYQQEGLPSKQGTVNYEGFNLAAYEQITPEQIAAIRSEFGIADKDVLVSNVARIDVWKGQDYFVKAIAQVLQSQFHVRALLVGPYASGGDNREQAFVQFLKQLIQDLNLSDRIIFTGFRADTAAIMSASDIVVHASSEPEPFGRVPIEGMLLGRPVVATAIGGPCETVQDQITGLLVPPKDPTAMAQAILQLIHDRDSAESMGKNAQCYARQNFSSNLHVAFVQQIYEKILSH